MVQLDFSDSAYRFNELRQICSFSKAFYAYLTAICQGAQGNYTNLESFKQEIAQLTRSSSRKVRKDFHKFLSESNRPL